MRCVLLDRLAPPPTLPVEPLSEELVQAATRAACPESPACEALSPVVAWLVRHALLPPERN